VYVFPSKQRFSQEQAIKDDRSPMYNKILELEDDIDELKKVVFEMSEKIDHLSEKDNS
jgi:uncharacterized coiled-coil DUF342 family protein